MNVIEAKKDILYRKMNHLSKKHWKLDNFERTQTKEQDKQKQDKQFIENSEELLKVGNEIFDNGNIVLYPNPVQDIITIHLPSNQSAELYFYNSLGQIINQFHISNSETSISLEKLTSGIYFYELSLKDKTQKGKLLKL